MRIWLDEPKTESYAMVGIDGKLVSSALRHDAPVDIMVEPREHDITIHLDGYEDVTQHVEVHKTIIQEFHFTLRTKGLGPPPEMPH